MPASGVFMGKKKNKNKKKKVNARKERYAKFRKDKQIMNFNPPDLTPEQQKQKQEDERRIDSFLRYSRNPPTREISERKMKSKR